MTDFDFHEVAFAVPPLAFSLSALVRGRTRAAVAWAVPLVFVKEDQGFTVAAIGLLIQVAAVREARAGSAVTGRLRGSAWGGYFLTVWGMAWSLLAIIVIIPHFNIDHRYVFWGHGGLIGSGNPLSATGGLVRQASYAWPVKLQTVVMLLLPTAFIALGSPVAMVALPSIALRFISTDSSYWGTWFHYNATLMPVLFIAAVDAMARWRPLRDPEPAEGPVVDAAAVAGWWPAAVSRSRALRTAAGRHGAPMMLAAAAALAFQFPLGGLWQGTTYEISPHAAAADAAMARVPDGATVQTTLNLLAPLAARTDTFCIGKPGNPATRYIVFDARNGGYSPAPANVPAFIKRLYPKGGYVQVFARDWVYVFRRG
jgi:hypothetical protein